VLRPSLARLGAAALLCALLAVASVASASSWLPGGKVSLSEVSWDGAAKRVRFKVSDDFYFNPARCGAREGATASVPPYYEVSAADDARAAMRLLLTTFSVGCKLRFQISSSACGAFDAPLVHNLQMEC
jgi:hypothetical protein